MHCVVIRTLRFGALATLMLVLFAGSVGIAGRVQAADSEAGELYFMLSPENDEQVYACVGQRVEGFFMAGVNTEPVNSDPLASLVPTQIQVDTDSPKVGTLSQRSWTVPSGKVVWWTYTPTKKGRENLFFTASVPNSSYKPIKLETSFPVLNCQYQLTMTGEVNNLQGQIKTYISYTAKGHFDILPQKNGPWKVRGYGETEFVATSNGTEGDVKCETTSPAEASGTLFIEGETDDSSNLSLKLTFSDAGAGVGQTCTRKDKSAPGQVRYIAWLPTGEAEGVLQLQASPEGDSVQLGIGEFNDRRWRTGGNSGMMIIEVTPVKGK